MDGVLQEESVEADSETSQILFVTDIYYLLTDSWIVVS